MSSWYRSARRGGASVVGSGIVGFSPVLRLLKRGVISLVARTACRSSSPPMISNTPITMNQIPSRRARTSSDEAGVAATAIPAMRLAAPKMIHQARPSRTPPEIPPMSAASPWTIQVMPMIRPMSDRVRCRCRIRTTPMTTKSSPAMPSQTRCGSAVSKTRIRWKMPERIIRMPSSTAITFTEVVGCKVTISPRIRVAAPRNIAVCHEPASTAGGAGCVPSPSTMAVSLRPVAPCSSSMLARHPGCVVTRPG